MRWLILALLLIAPAVSLEAQDGGCETERGVFYPTGSSKIWVWNTNVAEDRIDDLGAEWEFTLVSRNHNRESWRGLCVGS